MNRTSGMTLWVLVISVIIVLVSVVGTFTTLSAIPDLKLTQTPHAANVPAYAASVEEQVAQAATHITDQQGQRLFNSYGCVSCHNQPGNVIAPSLVGVGQRAATRRAGYPAAVYIYESITAPNAYVVESYPAGVMPQNFKILIPDSDLYSLIAWLMIQ